MKLHYVMATIALVAAMLSKPSAVVIPLFALAVDVVVVRRPWKSALISLAPWIVLVVPCLIWTKAAQPATDVAVAPFWARPVIALDALAFYLGKLLAPTGLTVDYGRTPVHVYASGVWWFSWIAPRRSELCCG
jgi:hypothetical protein